MIDLLQPYLQLTDNARLYPLICILVWGLILSRFPRRREMVLGRVETRWYPFTAILLTLPFSVWAGMRGDVGDTPLYYKLYKSAPSSLFELIPSLSADTKDPGYQVLVVLFKSIGVRDPQVFFLIIATLPMLCMVYIFRKYSSDYWVCIFLFVASTDYASWMLNGMRQFIVVCIVFAAFELVVRKKYMLYGLVVILASQIHGSAVMMLPLMYIMQGAALNRKTIFMTLCVVAMVPFIDRFTPIMELLLEDTQYSGTMSDEIWVVDDGTNPIRVLVYSVPALMALLGWRYIKNSTDPVFNMCINASFITMAIYLVSMVTSGIYIGRLPIYTTLQGYIALPRIIDAIFEKASARLVRFLMICCYMGFFYYQTFLAWGGSS